jgi:hypothetical protein
MRTHDAREELDYVHCRACLPRIRLAGNWPLNIRYMLAPVPGNSYLALELAASRLRQLIARIMQKSPRAPGRSAIT